MLAYHNNDPELISGHAYVFFRNLEEAVAMLKNTDCRIACVDLGGFDTHQNQLPVHKQLLKILALGLDSIYQDMLNVPNIDFLSLTMSEFGRTNRVNGSNGTDHGVGGAMIATGSLVKPGVYNCARLPSLQFGAAWTPLGANNPSPYEDAVVVQTHFQTVLAELSQDWFGLSVPDTDIVVPGFSGQTGRLYRFLDFV